jgi:hypothetical protein
MPPIVIAGYFGATLVQDLGPSRSGMSAMDAIVATTKTAAECIQFGDVTGTLEAGKHCSASASAIWVRI